jgi:hypothetical protein
LENEKYGLGIHEEDLSKSLSGNPRCDHISILKNKLNLKAGPSHLVEQQKGSEECSGRITIS